MLEQLELPFSELSCQDAYDLSCRLNEPMMLSLSYYVDDRGWSLVNLLQGVMSKNGQINYSCMHPGVIKAWHSHRLQVDFWLCWSGYLKIGIFNGTDKSWTATIGERRPSLVIIPPSLWHGLATIGNNPAHLLYYVTRAYDSTSPDEKRMAYDAVPGFIWHTKHR